MLPDALGRALGQILADYRKAVEAEHGRVEAESRAIIAELRAEVANLRTANEMLRVDVRRSVETEMERLREVVANVKDGRDGKDGADGKDGRDGVDGQPGPKGDKGDPGVDGAPGAKGDAGEPGPPGEAGLPGKDGVPGAEGAPGVQGDPGADGKDADPELIALACAAAVQKAIAARPAPKDGRDGIDGKDVDMPMVLNLVNEKMSELTGHVPQLVVREVSDAIAALPAPKDGRDGIDGKDGAPGPEGPAGRDGIDGKPGEKGEPGEDGKDAEVDYAYLEQFSQDKICALFPSLGKGEPGPVGPPGPEGRPGKDAADIAGAFQTVDGKALLTLTDGRVLDLGIVKGQDGTPGRDGADGKDGRDGKDGLSFNDLTDVAFDGVRTFSFKFKQPDGAEICRDFRLPHPVDRGVFRDGTSYERGDAVTWDGSLWIAQKDGVLGKPGTNGDWRLSVKHGRDGRDGKDGAKGDRGPDGRPGRDLTRMGGV